MTPARAHHPTAGLITAPARRRDAPWEQPGLDCQQNQNKSTPLSKSSLFSLCRRHLKGLDIVWPCFWQNMIKLTKVKPSKTSRSVLSELSGPLKIERVWQHWHTSILYTHTHIHNISQLTQVRILSTLNPLIVVWILWIYLLYINVF